MTTVRAHRDIENDVTEDMFVPCTAQTSYCLHETFYVLKATRRGEARRSTPFQLPRRVQGDAISVKNKRKGGGGGIKGKTG
jgi:hypothetical protein